MRKTLRLSGKITEKLKRKHKRFLKESLKDGLALRMSLDIKKKRKKAKEEEILEKAREISLRENKQEIGKLLSDKETWERGLKSTKDKASKERHKEKLQEIERRRSDLGYK